MALTAANKTDLANNIENRNPYSFLDPANPGMTMPPNWQTSIEEDSYAIGSWQFKGRTLRVKKAIRIPYTYQDKQGSFIREYLLIGYEGSGSD